MNQAAIHKLIASRAGVKKETGKLQQAFEDRFKANLSIIQQLYFSLYPEDRYFQEFKQLLGLLPRLFDKRPDELKEQDITKLEGGNWFQSEGMVGMQLYVDHFNKDLKGLSDKLSYMDEVGVNLLHLMPITTRPSGENDGGYAVNSYTEVDPRYGTKEDLQQLTRQMRSKGIYLMLDFVVNHTSDEYPWALRAAEGDQKYQNFYYTYPDRTIPDAFEKTLPEIFPQNAPGNFTWSDPMQRWVMTVFNRYQWDLNYSNPEVFRAMLTNLIEKVNLGVDVVRFDALAFLWKEIGTISQNLPQAHRLISLFRMCLQVVAPGVVILAEAIVAPRDVLKYFGEGIREGNECDIAYNATLMALLWDALATRKTAMIYKSLERLPLKPEDSTWINYIRCHDDIGLGFDDSVIREMGWDPQKHRAYLMDYFTGKVNWSQARGQLFMYNPRTGDGRITGSAASLLGLEAALADKDPEKIAMAVDKIIMFHGLILAFGGIPMIYAGDEIGTLNDYSYQADPSKREDSRWLNRPRHDWSVVAGINRKKSPAALIFKQLKKMIAIRKSKPVLADRNNTSLLHTGNDKILAFERKQPGLPGILVISNFDQEAQVIDAAWLQALGYKSREGFKDLLSGKEIILNSGLFPLNPYQQVWLESV